MKISRGIQIGPQKVVLYGPEGIGKSTFGAQFPAPLFLDVEASTRRLDVARVDPAPASWTGMLETIREFLREQPTEFSTLVLDTADWAEQMCIKHVCSKAQKDGIESFGYGKGYVYVSEAFGELLNLLEDVVRAGYNAVVLAHAKMRKFEQPDEMGAYDRWELKLSKNVAPMLKEWADMVLFANYKTMVVTSSDGKKAKAQGQGRRVLYTTHHSCWDAKNRHGLPDELPLDFDQIAHCIPARAGIVPIHQPGEQAEPATPVPVEKPASVPADTPPTPPALSEVPEALRQLMEQSFISEDELRGAIQTAGHFTGKETWEVLQERGYIDGYIIPQWKWFVSTIEADPHRLPF